MKKVKAALTDAIQMIDNFWVKETLEYWDTKYDPEERWGRYNANFPAYKETELFRIGTVTLEIRRSVDAWRRMEQWASSDEETVPLENGERYFRMRMSFGEILALNRVDSVYRPGGVWKRSGIHRLGLRGLGNKRVKIKKQ